VTWNFVNLTMCVHLLLQMWTTTLDSKKCWKCFYTLAWLIVGDRFKFSYNTKNWLNVSPWASFYKTKQKKLLNVEVKNRSYCAYASVEEITHSLVFKDTHLVHHYQNSWKIIGICQERNWHRTIAEWNAGRLVWSMILIFHI
jgi:hypothetical protein